MAHILLVCEHGEAAHEVVGLLRSLYPNPGGNAGVPEVKVFSNGPRAYAQILEQAQNKNPPGFIFLSEDMSFVSGLEIVGKLRKTPETAGIPTILFHNEAGDYGDVQEGLVNARFSLPITQEELRTVLSNVVEKLVNSEEENVKISVGKAMSEYGTSDVYSHAETVYLASAGRMLEWCRLVPWSRHPCLGLGRTYNVLGRYQDAIPWLKKAISLNPESIEAHKALVLAYKKTGRSFEEADEIRELVGRNPKSPVAHLNLGDAYLRDGDYRDAEAEFKEAIRLLTKRDGVRVKARCHAGLGRAYIMDGEFTGNAEKYESAEKETNIAKALDPALMTAYYNLLVVYKKQSRYSEIEQLMGVVRGLQPHDAEGWLCLFEIFFEEEEMEKGRFCLEKALKFDPENQIILWVAGEKYMQHGMFDDAVKEFSKAAEINPSDARIYNLLGICHRHMKRAVEAIASYKKAISMDPTDEHIHYNLARAYLLNDDLQSAKGEFEKAVGLNQGFVEAKNALAELDNERRANGIQ
ncbi:MAG: tetratricopeptide repeat protein [Nitrospinae bacterium]|nr:tetratricopeptide repeat protein [Nitrospinota bacterium]